MYLCYDLKGIQSFIFAVPRLRYICGGSALVDRFDREVVRDLEVAGAQRLFSGGGKGAFHCRDAGVVEELQRELVRAAHDDGMNISFGVNTSYTEAATSSDRSYPWLPSDLDGHPCQESGLYPSKQRVHPTVERRVQWTRGDRISRRFEEELLKDLSLDNEDWKSLEFFRDVSPDSPEGRAGARCLGNRNRWAIIAMDGNDLGAQHRAAFDTRGSNTTEFTNWLRSMSKALDECTREACRTGVQELVSDWMANSEKEVAWRDLDTEPKLTVPVRPLVVGGDDVVLLCHVRYALQLVRTICDEFAALSRRAAEREQAEREQAERGIDLWPATGGALTISAGILYAPVSLPLAAAIPYAESLLASAKQKGRRERPTEGPVPPSVDWESCTEGLIDTPAARRHRELRFRDGDNDEVVELTQRPYTLEGIEELSGLVEKYREIPNTIRHEVLPGLRQGYWDRCVHVARLAKHRHELAADLDEKSGRWRTETKSGDRCRSTDVVDALLLLEEDNRMSVATAEKP